MRSGGHDLGRWLDLEDEVFEDHGHSAESYHRGSPHVRRPRINDCKPDVISFLGPIVIPDFACIDHPQSSSLDAELVDADGGAFHITSLDCGYHPFIVNKIKKRER
jgi:hypothetical protein